MKKPKWISFNDELPSYGKPIHVIKLSDIDIAPYYFEIDTTTYNNKNDDTPFCYDFWYYAADNPI